MHQKTALVVEKNPDGRAALRELLTEWGYAVEEAANASGALALARTQRPAVVVIDLWLRRDAFDFIKRIRANDEHVFIVVFSGWMHLEAAARAAGADGYVVKPNVDALQRLLDRPTLPAAEVTQVPEKKDRAKDG